MSERVGVFVCSCGGRIGSALDVQGLAAEVASWLQVAAAQALSYTCSPDGLAALKVAIVDKALDRVVVAGCPPRLLERRLRQACQEAGLDGRLCELVDIREGCALVHADGPVEAQAKALDLIRMGVARVSVREATAPATAEVVPAALVIGGGLAGMTAALALADGGVPVKLVEREARLGGMAREAHTLVPAGRCAASYLARKIAAVAGHPLIDVLLESRLEALSGSPGRYTATVGSGANGRRQSVTCEAGAVIVATGACQARPEGLFRYDGERVITQIEFERELREHEHGAAPDGNGEAGNHGGPSLPGNVVMILCAGQRDSHVPYCSRACCLQAVKQALQVKAASPSANVTILFRDLYLGGEGLYDGEVRRARELGVQFIRYTPGSPPLVASEAVEVYDELSGQACRLSYDRIVLATALVPQPDAGMLARTLGLVRDGHGFFPEVRYRLRPQRQAGRGIYVCGAAHGPADAGEAEFQAASAAFQALHHLRAGRLEGAASVARVDEALCTGCGTCVASCPFGAIALRPGQGVLSLSQVDPLLCKGCGNCAVACPSRAIALAADSDLEVLAQIEAALAGPGDGRVRIIALGCAWSGHAAAELAGARKLGYPSEVRPIRVGCSARFDPLHVLWAFYSGADGVFLGGCPPGECHYVSGNRYAAERIEALRGLLASGAMDPRRVALEGITPDDAGDYVARITAFTDLVRALGRWPGAVGNGD